MVDPVALSLFARYLAFEILAKLSIQTDASRLSLVEKARNRIEQILHEKVEVSNIAADLKVSERTLRRHFQLELGKSVTEFVSERRLVLSKKYLTMHLSVADVAKRVGFESPSQLSRLFQKLEGVTPKAWQQSVAPTRRISRHHPWIHPQ